MKKPTNGDNGPITEDSTIRTTEAIMTMGMKIMERKVAMVRKKKKSDYINIIIKHSIYLVNWLSSLNIIFQLLICNISTYSAITIVITC
jgi:hypothetical protein